MGAQVQEETVPEKEKQGLNEGQDMQKLEKETKKQEKPEKTKVFSNQTQFQPAKISTTETCGIEIGLISPVSIPIKKKKKGITLNMNDFVGNTNGKLVKGSGYWNSCDDTSITSAGVLHATCEDKNGKDVKTSIDIKTLLVWKGDFLSRK